MTSDDAPVHHGGCLCGAVRYAVRGALRPVVNCHCGQCLRFHGHHGAYSGAEWEKVVVTGDALRWYRSSEAARRGFCGRCGSSLFWDRVGGGFLSIAAGSLDRPTGLRTVRHIYTAERADYYEITDGLEQFPGTMGAAPLPPDR